MRVQARLRQLLWIGVGVWVAALAIASERAAADGYEWGMRLQAAPSGRVAAEDVRADGVARLYEIQPGDLIVRVDEKDPRPFVGQPLRGVSSVVVRAADGAERNVEPAPLPAPLALAFLAVAAVFAMLGAAVYRWASDTRVGSVFLLLAGSFASALAVIHGAVNGYAWANLLAAASASVAAPSLAAFFLWFPRPLRFASRLSTGLVVGSLGLVVANVLLYVSGVEPPRLLWSLMWVWIGGNLLAVIALIGARGARRPDRHQLAPIGVGTAIGTAPLLLLFVLPRVLGLAPFHSAEVLWILGLGTIPLAFAYAILRHRLFALDALLRRAILRGSGALASVAVFLLTWLVLRGAGMEVDGAALLSAVLTALVAPQMLRQLRRALDAWLFRPMRLARASELPAGAATPGAVAAESVALVRELVPTVWAVFFVRDESGWRWLSADGEVPPPLSLAQSGTTVQLEEPPLGATLVPIQRSSPVVLGALLVGPRLDGSALHGIDLEAIGVLARGIADRLEVALLRERAEHEARFREGLSRLVRDLAAAGDVEDVLRRTTEHTRSLLGADGGASAWRREPGGALVLVAHQGAQQYPPSPEQLRRERVVRQPTSALVPGLAYALGEPGSVRALVAAVRSPGALPFSGEDERRASDIADHASGALHRAELAARAAEAELRRAAERHALQAERLRAEAEALRELDRMKSEFISIASHELRTPMTSILGFSELLLDQTGETDPNREVLSIVYHDAVQLATLLDNLLDISRIEEGRMRLEPLVVDLTAEVPPLLQVLGGPTNHHAFVTDIAPEARWVQADPAKLHQILTNLLSNAIKYSPEGGRVLFTARRQPGADRVGLAISDEGIGIPPEHHDRVFDRFHRVDCLETRGIRGTGLGLYIVRHLVELHGGTISVESEVGRGSTFRFSLPAAAEPAQPRPPHNGRALPALVGSSP